MHNRNVDDRKTIIKNIKKTISKKEKENRTLDNQLEELALSVAERRNVNEANGNTAIYFFYLSRRRENWERVKRV